MGRELLLYLVDYLLQNYQRLEGVRNLVNGVRLHIAPTINPDGYEVNTFYIFVVIDLYHCKLVECC